jgi:hypothetical protein
LKGTGKKEMTTKPRKRTTKRDAAETLAVTTAAETVAALDVQNTLSDLSQASLNISGDLTKISEALIAKHQMVTALDRTIEARKVELERLHDANDILLSLDELRAKQDNERLSFENEMTEKRASFDRAVADWDEAEKRRRDASAYAEQERQKTVLRQWEDQMHARQIQVRDQGEALSKQWAAREEVIKAREEEFKSLQDKAANFDALMKAAVAEAVGAATGRMKREYESEMKIKDAEHRAEISVLNGKLTSLSETLTASHALLVEERARTAKIMDQMETISTKAIDAASDRKLAADLSTTLSRGSNGESATPRGRS